jgi:hypothetical protein
MSESAPQPDRSSLADLLALSDARIARISERWRQPRRMTDTAKAAAKIMRELDISILTPSSAEATPWTLVTADRLPSRLVQAGMSSVVGLNIVILEPVLLTGAGLGRVAATLRRRGANEVHGVIGETLVPLMPPERLGLDGLHLIEDYPEQMAKAARAADPASL